MAVAGGLVRVGMVRTGRWQGEYNRRSGKEACVDHEVARVSHAASEQSLTRTWNRRCPGEGWWSDGRRTLDSLAEIVDSVLAREAVDRDSLARAGALGNQGGCESIPRQCLLVHV